MVLELGERKKEVVGIWVECAFRKYGGDWLWMMVESWEKIGWEIGKRKFDGEFEIVYIDNCELMKEIEVSAENIE